MVSCPWPQASTDSDQSALSEMIQPLLSENFEYQIKKPATTSGITMNMVISNGPNSMEPAMPR